MDFITRDTDYAIRALCSIVKNKQELVSVSRLVKDLKIPLPFLRGILQKLNKNGILKSYKGKGGGFKLALSPNKVSVADLIKVFQGPLKLQKHLFKRKICPNIKTCVLKKKIDRIEKFVVSELRSISIALLLKERDR